MHLEVFHNLYTARSFVRVLPVNWTVLCERMEKPSAKVRQSMEMAAKEQKKKLVGLNDVGRQREKM